MSIQPKRMIPEVQNTEVLIPAQVNNQALIPGKQFFYSHHPLRWDWDPKVGFLPNLSTHMLMAGVAGVSARNVNGVERFNVARLEADLHKRGHSVIRPNDNRLGKHNPYLASFPMVDGRQWWVFWATSLSLIRGSAPIFTLDRKEWGDFLITVRDSVLDPMPVDGFNNFQKIQNDRLKYVRMRMQAVGTNSVYEAQLKALEDIIEGSKATWVSMNHEAETSIPERDAEADFGMDYDPEPDPKSKTTTVKPKRARR